MPTPDENGSGSTYENLQCIPYKSPLRQVAASVATTVILLQIFLGVSLLVNRRKLFHKVVNAYAVNAFVINLFSSLTHVINLLCGMFETDEEKHIDCSRQKAWLFLKSLEGCYVFALAFSLALLINAVQSDLFRIHRTVSGASNITSADRAEISRNPGKKMKRSKGKLFHFGKKKKATYLIIFNFTSPLILALFSFLDLSCLQSCKCPSYYVHKITKWPCASENGKPSVDCHRAWAPLSKKAAFTLAVVCLLMFAASFLLLIHSFKKFSQLVKDHKKASRLNCKFRKKGSSPVLIGYAFETQSTVRESISERESNPEIAVCDEPSTHLTTINNDVDKNGNSNETEIKEDDGGGASECNSNSNDILMIDDVKFDEVELDDMNPDIIENDSKKKKQAVSSSKEVVYETVTFSNLLLLARLKKNLKLLAVIFLSFCIGYGGVMIYTILLCVDDHFLPNFDLIYAVLLPALVSDGVTAVMLCCTTAGLKMAVLHPIRKAFFICEKVEIH